MASVGHNQVINCKGMTLKLNHHLRCDKIILKFYQEAYENMLLTTYTTGLFIASLFNPQYTSLFIVT